MGEGRASPENPRRPGALAGAKSAYSGAPPGWSEQVTTGDILVAGRNFGAGSARPAAEILRVLGLRALVAESINGLFFRNCVNYALPVIEYPGILDVVNEGDIVRVNVGAGIA